MGTHSKDGKPARSWLGLLTRHRGTHTDERVLEPDPPNIIPDNRPVSHEVAEARAELYASLSPDMFQETAPLSWDEIGNYPRLMSPELTGRHLWRRITASAILCAAVGLMVFSACAVLDAYPGTSPGHGRIPIGMEPDDPSGTGTDGAEPVRTPMNRLTLPTPQVTSGSRPQRADGSMLGASGVPAVTAPPRSGNAAGQVPTQTGTSPATPMDAPAVPAHHSTVPRPPKVSAPAPTPIRVPEASYVPRPAVTISIPVPVPSLPVRLP